jgi:organic hydroperoxide reductase OsmC/OhrA
LSQHVATIDWKRETEDFVYETYNRAHTWRFESGITVQASSAPAFFGTPDRVDPEEAFVAAVSACHMLTFLAICARRKLVVNTYLDEAVGYLEKNASGKLAITRVDLAPRITFAGEPPSPEQLNRIHEHSHRECFIANSVLSEIVIKSPDANGK